MKRCKEHLQRNVYGKVLLNCAEHGVIGREFASVNAAMEAFTTHVADVKAARKVTIS